MFTHEEYIAGFSRLQIMDKGLPSNIFGGPQSEVISHLARMAGAVSDGPARTEHENPWVTTHINMFTARLLELKLRSSKTS